MIPVCLHRIGMAVVLGALMVSAAAAAEKKSTSSSDKLALSSAEIAKSVAELNDDSYVVRERATRQLTQAGASALDALSVAADADKPEPADRAVWIMRRLSMGKDAALKRRSLEHLASLKKRPEIAAAARASLVELEHNEAVAAFEELGASYAPDELAIQLGAGPVFRLGLDERWTGKDSDLARARQLTNLRKVIIIGTNTSIDGLKELGNCKQLQELCLYGTRLTSEDVAKLRTILPQQIEIDYRNGALLGVAGNQLDVNAPAVVGRVTAGSAAAAAGIQQMDIIQKFEGEPVANFKSLTQKIGKHRPGDEVTIEVLRNGQPMQFKAKLGQWKMME